MSSSNAPRRRLPPNPSVENLRKQAKRLARETGGQLSQAQHQLALEFGATNWVHLLEMVDKARRKEAQRNETKNDREGLAGAANSGDLARVRVMLESGEFTQHDLDLALARSVLRFRERHEIARLLIEHGADPNGEYGGSYGPIVFVTGECLDPGGLQFLIDAGADVTFEPIDAKYGRQCPLSHTLGTYVRGCNDAKRRCIDLLMQHRAYLPPEVTPPLLAIHRDDSESLARLIDANPGLIMHQFESMPYAELSGGSLLHYACEFGAERCIDLLLERKADVNLRSTEGVRPLHCAARGATADIVMKLLDAGALQWIADNNNREPRHYAEETNANPHREAILEVLTSIRFGDDAFKDAVAAIDAGDVERLKQLLRDHPHLITARVEGGDAITRGYFSKPALLHFVACNPQRDGVKHMPPRIVESTTAILDAGADADVATQVSNSHTTLALVASSGPAHDDGLVTPMLELLVSRGANPSHGISAAILHRYTDTVRTLIRLGASHDLLSAAGLGEIDELKKLLIAEHTHDQLLRAGWAAAMNGQAKPIDILIDAGLDPNARLPRPFEPVMLHEAAWANHRDVCERLIARGADPTIRDRQYNATPSGWARHAGHAELADYLAQAEAR